MLQQLNEQLSFINKSTQEFDKGDFSESKRLALHIRILCHDTKASHSLLNQLNIKNTIYYYDTAEEYNPQNLLSYTGLTLIQSSLNNGKQTTQYKAKLDDFTIYKFKTFDSWWNQVIIKDSNQTFFTRKDLILSITNQDGGAHVDPAIKEDYNNLSRNNSIGWFSGYQNKELPINNIELHSVRQISHELLLSLKKLNSK